MFSVFLALLLGLVLAALLRRGYPSPVPVPAGRPQDASLSGRYQPADPSLKHAIRPGSDARFLFKLEGKPAQRIISQPVRPSDRRTPGLVGLWGVPADPRSADWDRTVGATPQAAARPKNSDRSPPCAG